MDDRDRPSASEPVAGQTFDDVVVPHLAAGRRLARWLMRNEHDAEDVLQDASLRAFQYFQTFTGGNGRAWFLRIIRNTCLDRRGHCLKGRTDPFDEEQHSIRVAVSNPEALLLQTDDAVRVARTLANLPDRFHQLLVLREFEGLSYRELADVIGVPIGTVMSRLARARDAFRAALNDEIQPASTQSCACLRRESVVELVCVPDRGIKAALGQ